MIHTINVNYLTKRDPKFSSPFEREMKVALDRAGLTQTTLAIDLNIGQSTVNNYYKRPGLLVKKGVPFAVRFVKAHHIPEPRAIEIVKEIFGTDYDSYVKEAGQIIEQNCVPIPQTISRGELVSIRDLGAIQAGLKGLSSARDDIEYVNVLQDDLNGYRPENCFRVVVNGESMVSDDISQRIMPGSRAIFHVVTPQMQPKEGDIVAVWLHNEEIGVIKTFHKGTDYLILNSFNKAHRPIILDKDTECVVHGILVSVTQMYRT